MKTVTLSLEWEEFENEKGEEYGDWESLHRVGCPLGSRLVSSESQMSGLPFPSLFLAVTPLVRILRPTGSHRQVHSHPFPFQENPFLIQVGGGEEQRAPFTPSWTLHTPFLLLIYLCSQELLEPRVVGKGCELSLFCFVFRRNGSFIFISILLCAELSIEMLKWKEIS